MSNPPKSPAKRKLPPSDPVENTIRTRSKSRQREGTQDVPLTPSKSPGKADQACKVCDFVGKSVRSHLHKNPKCKASYDEAELKELEAQAKKRNLEMDRERKKQRYHNEPGESPRKRAASKEYYTKHTPEKRASMRAYNEDHREEINQAMRDLNLHPEKKTEGKD